MESLVASAMEKLFEVNSNTKIFVACPPRAKTGGTELIHQLVSCMNRLGLDAYIFFYSGNKDDAENVAFIEYKCPFVMNINNYDDNCNNILIVPEIRTRLLYRYRHIQKAIWWLSVDFYQKFLTSGTTEFERELKDVIKRILGFPNFKFGKDKNSIVQLCQSYYAVDFVTQKGCKKVAYLSDYINQIYLKDTDENTPRQDIILYNPKKGLEKTELIMAKYKERYEGEWIALQGFTNEQVYELLKKSKVYIDFGEHPGKDRFPREACACGCCVITGKKGAAKFYNDVPIGDRYKFDDDGDIEDVVERIHDCCSNYSCNIAAFDDYRKFIKGEKDAFEKDVADLFC